jgi:hypothetical protein
MSLAGLTPQTEIIELHFENRDGQVRVMLPDNHIMAMSVEVAVHACRAFKHQILFKSQFDSLLPFLGEWIEQHRENVKQAYLTTRDSGLLFLVVTNDIAFKDSFEDELTSLDIEVANDNDYNLITLNVLAIPPSCDEDTKSFISKKLALRFTPYGK